MSSDPDDTAFEEALRGDLPSAETSSRLRRRLLAAGLAIGGGAAASTAAAAGAAAAPSAVATGLVGKGLALSWGFKLGALAVVAIPTVGLIVESNTEPQLAAPSANVTAAARPARAPAAAAAVAPAPLAVDATIAPSEPTRAATPAARVLPAAPETAVPSQALPAGPSQVEFAAPEVAASKAESTLAEETRLLDGAFAALAAGQAARAAELVAEHQRRFPKGLLQKERERARTRLSEMTRGE